MGLDPTQRERIAADLLRHLAAAVPGSEAIPRGSLADGRADLYSDIDLLWEVPGNDFAPALSHLPAILERAAPVSSLRFDPDFQQSLRRRLVFIRFAGVPLFWRVDLVIFARSAGRDDALDRDNPLARGSDWSIAESSLANAVAAIKALLRGKPDVATALLERGEARIGLVAPVIAPPAWIVRLAIAVRERDPDQRDLADEVLRLAVTAL